MPTSIHACIRLPLSLIHNMMLGLHCSMQAGSDATQVMQVSLHVS